MSTAAKTFHSTITNSLQSAPPDKLCDKHRSASKPLGKTKTYKSSETKTCLWFFLFSILYLSVGVQNSSSQKLEPQLFSDNKIKFVIYGNLVVEQENTDTEQPPPPNPQKPIITFQKKHTRKQEKPTRKQRKIARKQDPDMFEPLDKEIFGPPLDKEMIEPLDKVIFEPLDKVIFEPLDKDEIVEPLDKDEIVEPPTDNISIPPPVKTVLPDFNFTELHKKTLKNVYINLAYQTECNNFMHFQCWNSKLEFEDGEIIDDIHVKIDGIVTPGCKLLLCPKCTQKYGIRGYKMVCDNNPYNPFLSFFPPTKNTHAWLMPRNGVFFMLEKGNYHSAWQENNFLGQTNRQNIKAAQDVIKKFNYCKHVPKDELLLVITKIHEVTNRSNALWFAEKSVNMVNEGEMISLPIHCYIHTGANLDAGIQLHERVHEYINPYSLHSKVVKYGDELLVYMGEKTVALVKEDAKIDHTLEKNIIFIPKLGKYGLILQDVGHLGNWGTDASPSSYHHQSTFKIGKYTMSVINESGYYMM